MGKFRSIGLKSSPDLAAVNGISFDFPVKEVAIAPLFQGDHFFGQGLIIMRKYLVFIVLGFVLALPGCATLHPYYKPPLGTDVAYVLAPVTEIHSSFWGKSSGQIIRIGSVDENGCPQDMVIADKQVLDSQNRIHVPAGKKISFGVYAYVGGLSCRMIVATKFMKGATYQLAYHQDSEACSLALFELMPGGQKIPQPMLRLDSTSATECSN